MTDQNNIIAGDHVRVLSGSHTGEIAIVGKVMYLSNRFGAYRRVSLRYEGGKVANRDIDSVEKVNDYMRSGDGPHANVHGTGFLIQ